MVEILPVNIALDHKSQFKSNLSALLRQSSRKEKQGQGQRLTQLPIRSIPCYGE